MKSILFTAVAALALGACATGPSLSDSQRLEIHKAHAGAPVKSFYHYGSLYNWVPLGDAALTVWLRPNTAYLLTLASDCPHLEYGRTISLGDQSGSVFAGLDNVTVIDQATPIPCRIERIQPVDAQALQEAEREARDELQASVGGT